MRQMLLLKFIFMGLYMLALRFCVCSLRDAA